MGLATLIVFAAIFAAVAVKRYPVQRRKLAELFTREIRTRLGTYSLSMLMHTMLAQMHASAMPSITKSYVPNEMTFGLHPRDVRRWGRCFDQLSEELVELMIDAVSSDPELYLSDAGLTIRLTTDDHADPGRPTFEARMSSRVRADHVHSRTVPPVPGLSESDHGTVRDGTTVEDPSNTLTILADDDLTSTSPAHWRLVFAEDEVELLFGEAVVGRGRDADIRIDAQDVSRAHARFALLDDRVTLMDLHSGNGTFVNGKQIAIAMLDIGDEVRFGSTTVARLDRV